MATGIERKIEQRKRRWTAERKRERILELRLEGKSERQIAAIISVAPSYVHRTLDNAMQKLQARQLELAEQIQAVHYERLEELYHHARKRALGRYDNGPMWMLRCIQILEREAKLMGVAANVVPELGDGLDAAESAEREVTTWDAYERRIVPIRPDVEREA